MRVIITQPGTSPRSEWFTPPAVPSAARRRGAGDHQVSMLSPQATNTTRVPKFFTVSSFLVFWFSVHLVLLFFCSSGFANSPRMLRDAP
jgi:hypothetical protein